MIGTRRAIGVGVVVGLMAGVGAVGSALATPSRGFVGVPLVERATLEERVRVNADRIKFQTKRPTDVRVVTATVAPGGTSGWHSHAGMVIAAVTQGTGVLYFEDCHEEIVETNRVIVESATHGAFVFRNEGTTPLVFVATFLVPEGSDFTFDEDNPGCPVD